MTDIERLRRDYEKARDAAMMSYIKRELFGGLMASDVFPLVDAWQAASDRLAEAEAKEE